MTVSFLRLKYLNNLLIIHFCFEDMIGFLPPEERVAILIDYAEKLSASEELIRKETGRAPIESAVKGINMFKECIEILRRKHPYHKVQLAG